MWKPGDDENFLVEAAIYAHKNGLKQEIRFAKSNQATLRTIEKFGTEFSHIAWDRPVGL